MTVLNSVVARSADSDLALATAPLGVLAADGSVNFGKYAGPLTQIDWRGLAAPAST
ncbi:MAG: hypothetical protein NTY70_02030 [Burkholderiales bacterium]|nr:hypothetical protein [Burkholderiales bacterium]